MLKVTNLKVVDEDKVLLSDVSFELEPGKTYYLNGANGSGKSTLVNIIAGVSSAEVASGSIQYQGEDLLEMDISTRSLKGIFLANQSPVEVPGVSLMQYLRLIYNVRRSEDEKLPVFKFRSLIKEKVQEIGYPEELLDRNLNEGMSGGEKKKTEILQMLLLEPKLVLLDEVDSGLDKESIKNVFAGISKYKNSISDVTVVVISHYDQVQKYLPVDKEFRVKSGKLENL